MQELFRNLYDGKFSKLFQFYKNKKKNFIFISLLIEI